MIARWVTRRMVLKRWISFATAVTTFLVLVVVSSCCHGFSTCSVLQVQTTTTTTTTMRSFSTTAVVAAAAAATTHVEDTTEEVTIIEDDARPHDHRAKETRKARRLNHAFRYLYRHDDYTTCTDNNNNSASATTTTITNPREYLKVVGGYTDDEIDQLHKSFPPLLDLDVQRHLKPKLRFLKETLLNIDNNNNNDQEIAVLPAYVRKSLPPQYYGSRLERIVAPRHAFLMYHNLLPQHNNESSSSSSRSSWWWWDTTATTTNTSPWQDFFKSCRNTKQFAALCNQWIHNNQNQSHYHYFRYFHYFHYLF